MLGWKHRAGIEVVADGLVVGVGEDWLEVHDGSAEPRRGTFDRMTACTAADRAFVDAVAGRTADPERSVSDHAYPTTAKRCGPTGWPRRRPVGRLRCPGDGVNDTGDRALVIERPGHATVREVAATEGPVAVRTRFTGLSAGTELSFLTGTNPALTSSFDPELGLFRTDRPARATRWSGWATWRSRR